VLENIVFALHSITHGIISKIPLPCLFLRSHNLNKILYISEEQSLMISASKRSLLSALKPPVNMLP